MRVLAYINVRAYPPGGPGGWLGNRHVVAATPESDEFRALHWDRLRGVALPDGEVEWSSWQLFGHHRTKVPEPTQGSRIR